MDTNLDMRQREADPAEAPETPAELPALARMIAADPLFDEAFYARTLGISGSRLDLATHYLTTGEAAMLSPSPEFDVRFYRDANPDVAQGGGSALLHYLVHGQAERRYPNRRALRRDAERVTASGLFDAQAYAWDRGRPARPGLSDVEDYLVRRDHRAAVGEAFDGAFYAAAYEDVLGEASGYAAPILHYIGIGRAQSRVCTEQQLLRHEQEEREHFNERYYRDQYQRRFPGQPLPEDALRHYILTGSRLGLDPAPNFSSEYYLRRHPDLHQSRMALFLHYVTYGKSEGRVGRPDFTSCITRGEVEFDSGKPTLLVANHEASRTGAPLVGLNLGGAFADTHNVVAYLGAPGPLLHDFAARSCAVVTGPFSALDAEYLLRELKETHRLSAVLLNSVETDAFAPAALQADLPSVALVHEFAEYTLPTGRMSAVVELVDRVITPASLIRDSVQAELLATRSGRANNLAVRPQGTLPNLPGGDAADDLTPDDIRALIGADGPGTKVKVVLGAGRVQMRKGVDLFVQTAAEARRLAGDDIRFVWVGDGYAPGTDVHYSAWIADMVRRLDLESHVFFLPAQGSLHAMFAVSDVFYLPSRLDPFPNVALDALRAGRAVVCFDRATGVVDALSDAPGRKAAVGATAPYCDVAGAAKALVRLLQPAEAKRALGNAALAQRCFAFADYAAAIAEQLTVAAALRDDAVRAVDAVLASGRFDAAFHDDLPAPVQPGRLRAAAREYVARGQKGIVACNPCPGFNEGVARLRLIQPGPALAGPDTSPTHRCVVLRDDPPASAAGLRTALHLHLHYPELAAEFAARLSAACGPQQAAPDLILTTTSDARRVEVEYAFRGYKGGSTRVLVVPNRGRDIGPFLTEVGGLVQAGQYDVVGHLHGKRSLAVDAGLGDRWRSFLLDTLLGGAGGLPAVLSLFADDPGLGLVFAEDRHCVGWSKNRPIAEALAARMQPPPALPAWPVFPIGTMFWARPAALAPLWALSFKPQDLPGEPVAYDGTALHAVERMLPAICESTGHGWCTVHREGVGW